MFLCNFIEELNVLEILKIVATSQYFLKYELEVWVTFKVRCGGVEQYLITQFQIHQHLLRQLSQPTHLGN